VFSIFTRKAAGASDARSSLRPLFWKGDVWKSSGVSRRGNEKAYLNGFRHSATRMSANPESISPVVRGAMDSGSAPFGASRNDENELFEA
jgi:hypothetical protein